MLTGLLAFALLWALVIALILAGWHRLFQLHRYHESNTNLNSYRKGNTTMADFEYTDEDLDDAYGKSYKNDAHLDRVLEAADDKE